MTNPTVDELTTAATALLAALDATHETCSSTDIHHQGGIAGQAITPHCHWQCRTLGAHDDTRAALTAARTRLEELIVAGETGPCEPDAETLYRVASTPEGAFLTEPMHVEDAIRLVDQHQAALRAAGTRVVLHLEKKFPDVDGWLAVHRDDMDILRASYVWPQYRVQSTSPGRHTSQPVAAARAIELLDKCDDTYGFDGVDFHLQVQLDPGQPWLDVPDWHEGALRAAAAEEGTDARD